MQWINFSDRLPAELVSIISDTTCIRQVNTKGVVDNDYFRRYAGNAWDISKYEWLDESVPSFTIDDIKQAYNIGWSRGYNHNYDDAGRYLKQHYNIDIDKQ